MSNVRKSSGSRAATKAFVESESQAFVKDTVQKLDALAIRRDAWEQGSFKTSNEELHGLLADSLELYLQNDQSVRSLEIKAHGKQFSSDLRAELTQRLKGMGIKVQKNSGTLTMLVRYVFKSDRKRAHGYSQVLMAAIQDHISPSDLPNYIASAGGIEEIKRRMVLSDEALEKREQFKHATSVVQANFEHYVLNPIASVELVAEGEYAVMLGKPNGNGVVEIVGVLNDVNESFRNEVLSRIAKYSLLNGGLDLPKQGLDPFESQPAANEEIILKQA